ncbi:MAG: hypothetical protein KBC43_03130 [Bacteroidales bacterium]|nr:hypothetical protein [Bacteroidales bacterium]
MKKTLIISLVMLFNSSVWSQIDTSEVNQWIRASQQEIQSLRDQTNKQEKRINYLDQRIKDYEKINQELLKKNISLEQNLSEVNEQLTKLNEDLSVKIDQAQVNASDRINGLDKSISRKTVFWTIGILLALLLIGISYYFLRKSINSKESNLSEKLENSSRKLSEKIDLTRKALEEESIKLDAKLLGLLEKQMEVRKLEPSKPKAEESPVDHSLALKVADEIVRIQKNLSQMEESVRGKKQLEASVGRLMASFEAGGYEIVDMLNKPYNDGMLVQANFRPDDNLKTGEQIITRIIKPQVNFNGVMIQSAQIEVSQGV